MWLPTEVIRGYPPARMHYVVVDYRVSGWLKIITTGWSREP